MSKTVKEKLSRLQAILHLRKPWQEAAQQVERMRSWIREAEHILSGEWVKEGQALTTEKVAEHFDIWLMGLVKQLAEPEERNETEQACLLHLVKISQNLRPRLLLCYDVEDLPRTNNDMEGYIRGLKTRYRRISGRKNWNAYLLRYGQSIAYFDCLDRDEVSEGALLAKFRLVDRKLWREARVHQRFLQTDRLNVFRFRHKQETYLQNLETRWDQTCDRT
jgi:hypothetical protein